MTKGEALRRAAEIGRGNLFVILDHAAERMSQRTVRRKDIANALSTATEADEETETRWKFSGGVDLDGDPLGVVVAFEWNTCIVTVF